MSKCIIWKYELANYFEDLSKTCIDKIQFTKLPLESFPVFDDSTEEIWGIAQYKPGDFAVRLIIDGGETSYTLGDSVYDFFMAEPRKNKFLIGIEFGDRQYWGTFTNEFIDFSYNSRTINILFKHMLTEAKEQISKSYVGLLDIDRPLENFLVYVLLPSDTYRLEMFCKFVSYSLLIGGAADDYKVRYQIQSGGGSGAPAWVNTLDVWQQFVEIMVGAGLNYDIEATSEFIITNNLISFRINIFSLDQLVASGITMQVIEATDRTLFNKLEWLFIKYRRVDISHFFAEIETEVWDGIISDGSSTYDTDKLRPTVPSSPIAEWGAPCFLYGDSVPNRFSSIITYPAVNSIHYTDKNTRIIDLPLYAYTFPFQGYSPPFWIRGTQGETIAYSNIIRGSSSNNWDFRKVQQYAINQYGRYIGFKKRSLEIKAIYDPNNSYKLWQTVNVVEGARSTTFWISRIQNLNYATREVDLTLIEF